MKYKRSHLIPYLAVAVLASACESEPGAQFLDEEPLTQAQCAAQGGLVVGDPGDGSVFQPGFRCASGLPPIATITFLEGEPVAVEGAVCCP